MGGALGLGRAARNETPAMSGARRGVMAVLAAVCLWSLAFLFGMVTERMRGGCDRTAAVQRLASQMEERR